jgi:hypothetical protein
LLPGRVCLARSIEQAVPLVSLTVPMPAQLLVYANKHTTASNSFIDYLTIADTGLTIAPLLERTVIVL